MSGHKRTTITLSREELRGLENASKRLGEVEHDFQKIQQQIAHMREQSFVQSQHEMEARQQALDYSLAGVSAHLASIEMNTSQAVIAHSTALQHEINQMGQDVWENTALLLNEHTQEMETAFREGQEIRQAQFHQLRRSINRMQNSEQERTAYAEQAVHEAHTLMESMVSLYSSEETALHSLQAAERQVQRAAENLQAGFSEAALVAAQQTFEDLSRLRFQVETQLQRRQVISQMVQEAYARVENLVRINRRVRAVNPQGEPLDTVIDVDFWSGGAWAALNQRLNRIQAQLIQPDLLDSDASQHLIDEMEAIENDIQHIVFNARLAVISSQVRFNIAECVVAALQEQGFALENSAYLSNDMRSPYQVQLCNFEGTQVMVNLAPNPGDPIAHELDIAYQDPEFRTEHEMRQRAGELSMALNSYGLQLNGLRALPDPRGKTKDPVVIRSRRVQEVQQSYGKN